jgi:hypothetical protein
MKTTIQFIVTAILLLTFPPLNFAQTPDLGSVTHYVLFTKTGAMDNTGVSEITGNIGTNTGDISGFVAPTVLHGSIITANPITAQNSADLLAAYNQLYNTAPTNTTHTPSFGGGETLVPGVYAIAAAGSVAGDLTLDAQGNPNAIFIFKFGGAFTTGASTTIFLINGAMACNVFWGAEGAISMAAITDMKGTLIANNGAISMGADGILEGRMFSTTGAVSIYASSVMIPPCAFFPLPVRWLFFTGVCNKQTVLLKWATAIESGKCDFSIERSIEGYTWQKIGTVTEAGNESSQHLYSFTDFLPNIKSSFYRIKQTDINGQYSFGDIIIINNCADAEPVIIYPNPSTGKFELQYSGNNTEVRSIKIFNCRGKELYYFPGFHSNFDLSCKPPGIYFIHIQLDERTVKLKMVSEK